MKVGFLRIFWGLLVVVLDIRINSIDLILPDFLGYILIASGLTLLVPHHKWFRTARVIAVIMIFVSLPSLVDVKIDSHQLSRLKREWLTSLTGNLSHLLPPQVDSARLVRVTSSGNAVDANRTNNPERDQDRVMGEYSDGTVVLFLRYASSDEARQALEHKQNAEYSFDGMRKRAETDLSFKGDHMSSGGSSGSEGISSVYSNVSAGDRVIQQWWSQGWTWWNPATWRDEGGWKRGNLLYIVEGYSSSAEAYRLAFADKNDKRGAITFDGLFPISIVGELLNTLLIWAICSGVIALALASNNYALMMMAKTRRAMYLVLTLSGVAFSLITFLAPEAVADVVTSAAFVLIIVYAVVTIVSVVLIMGLMRKAANTLPPTQA